jgi:hypothetical protein
MFAFEDEVLYVMVFCSHTSGKDRNYSDAGKPILIRCEKIGKNCMRKTGVGKWKTGGVE